MLILTRKPGENICIFLEDGREILIRVMPNRDKPYNRSSIKVGIDAPKSINIVREELLVVQLEDEEYTETYSEDS